MRVVLALLIVATTIFGQKVPYCPKDACFKAITVQRSGGPNASRRTSDCRAVLRAVIGDDKIVTVTQVKTVYKSTRTIITTSTYSAGDGPQKRSVTKAPSASTTTSAPDDESTVTGLQPRGKVVIAGRKPVYASACKNL